MKITETNFVEQLKEHNEKALSYMIQQYGGLLSSVVNRHLRLLKEYREECLNDVFLGIWKNIGYYDEKKVVLPIGLPALPDIKRLTISESIIRMPVMRISTIWTFHKMIKDWKRLWSVKYPMNWNRC